MLRNFIKTALRNLLRNRTFSFINIFGLSLSISVCVVIIMLISDQMNYDSHLKQNDKIFRVNTERLNTDEFINEYATTTIPLAEKLKEEFASVDKVAMLRRGFGNDWIDFGQDINIPIAGFFANQDFLDVFEYELLHGDKQTALTEPNSVVLTKEAAEKLYDIDNPVGELLKVGDLGEYKVTGVLKETENKSHIVFEALGSYSSIKSLEKDSLLYSASESWDVTTAGWIYIRTQSEDSKSAIEDQLAEISKKKYTTASERQYKFYLQSLSSITPGPLLGNSIGPVLPDIFVYFLTGLSFIVMVLACLNYTNLSVARSLTRAKEVGIRKVAGAQKSHIFLQFISESIIIALFSLLFSFILLVLLKPAFLSMSFAQLLLWDLHFDAQVVVLCLLFAVGIGVVAGFLPALILSSFNPSKVLKDLSNLKLFSRMGLRKTLLVIQFAFSLIFIISTLLVYNQFKMMVDANYGFSSDNIMNVRLNGTDYDLLKSELEKQSSLLSVAASSHVPAMGTRRTSEVRLQQEDEPQKFSYFAVDDDYVENLELKLLAGKNFSQLDVKEEPNTLLINEKMVGLLGYSSIHDAIGQSIIVEDSSMYTISGVLKDYNHEALLVEIGPMGLIPSKSELNFLQVKYANHENALKDIEDAWATVNPNLKIDTIGFYEEIRSFYDLMFGDLVNVIAFITFLAISIACLGLLGMAAFTIETKVKEISIRKVLGASDKEVVLHLSKGFIILLSIAIILAVPAAYFINSMWLESLAYRVPIDFTVIGLSVLILVILGVLTIGSQTIKAAIMNPTDALKSE